MDRFRSTSERTANTPPTRRSTSPGVHPGLGHRSPGPHPTRIRAAYPAQVSASSHPGPTPQLSVVVPFYNVAGYAAQTLRSLAANAAPEVELVLVDDASTDDTAAILAEGAARLPGATLLTLPVNRGLSGARNAGLAVARGRYLTFLDGDDVVAPGYYTELLAAARSLRCDVLRTDHVQVRGRERTVHRVPYGPRGVVRPARTGIGPAHRRSSVDAPYAWAGVYDRRLLECGLLGFDESLRTCEDRPWAWRLHLEADTLAVVGLHGVRYRREVAASLTQLADERQFDFLPAFEGIIARVRADREAEVFLPKAVRSFCAMACHHLAQLDRYPVELGERLRRLTGRALRSLPTGDLDPVVALLDPVRAETLTRLRWAA
ncbi:MAG: hypothetical protein JWP61_1354 [Friedmanniella sp.]|nr:hypothetical protein [Friedmanniella sp.]